MRPIRKTVVSAYDPETGKTEPKTLGELYDEYRKNQGHYSFYGFTEWAYVNQWVKKRCPTE